jgi:hypothetical protein
MTIYIDAEYKCHTTNTDGNFREVESEFFDSKCTTFIEGYRFVPVGESWTRSDGIVFHGEMIAPWKPYSELDNAQREYERQMLEEYEVALAEMDLILLDMQYQSLMEDL